MSLLTRIIGVNSEWVSEWIRIFKRHTKTESHYAPQCHFNNSTEDMRLFGSSTGHNVASLLLPYLQVKGKGKGTVQPLMEVFNGTAIRSVTCHMGIHSVTCYPTQVNTPRLNPSHAVGTRFTYPREMEGWVDLVDLVAPRPGVEPETFPSPVQSQTARVGNKTMTEFMPVFDGEYATEYWQEHHDAAKIQFSLSKHWLLNSINYNT